MSLRRADCPRLLVRPTKRYRSIPCSVRYGRRRPPINPNRSTVLLCRSEAGFFLYRLRSFDLGGLFFDQRDKMVDDVGVF